MRIIPADRLARALAALLLLCGISACTTESAAEPAASPPAASAPTPCRPADAPDSPEWQASAWYEATLEAIQAPSLERVEAQLADGGDVNARDSWQGTLLLAAVGARMPEPPEMAKPAEALQQALQDERETRLRIVERLLAHGADPNLADDHGLTPALRAAADIHPDAHAIALLERLLTHGADLNHSDDQGRSALMHATSRGSRTALVQFLLDHGADPSLTDCEGNTALGLHTHAQADVPPPATSRSIGH